MAHFTLKTVTRWAIPLTISALLQAQTPPAAQSLDIIFDQEMGAVRPAIGPISSALVTGALDAGMPLGLAEISRRRDYVLATGRDDSNVYLLKYAAGKLSSQPVNAPAGPDSLFLSPSGSSAAIYYRSAQLILVLTGLPGSPVVTRSVSVTTSGGTMTLAAISDDGQVLMTVVRFNSRRRVSNVESIYLELNGALQSAGALPAVSGMAFLLGSHDALSADSNLSGVYRIATDSALPNLKKIAGPEDGISSLIGVALSLDNQHTFAVTTAGDVFELNPGGGARKLASCSCKPSGLYAMPGNARFRLNNLPQSPLWIFDGDSSQPDVLFVPAASTTGKEN